MAYNRFVRRRADFWNAVLLFPLIDGLKTTLFRSTMGKTATTPKSPGPAGSKSGEAKSPPAATVPPAMRQYLEQKARVGDAILLFRMGDFYETFYDDARTIARVLGLTLTARDKNSGSPIPLAGVPYHAADRYVARLVRAGYKVAISEQLEDPKTAKGVVKRDVVRIITPGTLTDENLLDERADNLLVALVPSRDGWECGFVGLACVSLSSGRFDCIMVPHGTLADELTRIAPAELLVPEADIDDPAVFPDHLRAAVGCPVSPRPRHVFDPHLADRALKEHFGVSSLTGFGFDQFDASLCAAAAVLDYLRETQKGALGHIVKLTPRSLDGVVMIDQFTLRSLEVERTLRDGSREGTLLGAVDLSASPMGSRLLRQWLCFPVNNVREIRRRQQAISDLRNDPGRLQRVRDLIREMGDIERIIGRLGVGRSTPRDLVGLGRTLQLCAKLPEAIGPSLNGSLAVQDDILTRIAHAVCGHSELADYLVAALKGDAPAVIRDGGFIADGHHAELDRLRSIGQEGHRYLAEYQAREIERTGISSLKVGYNSVFGYYIEVTHQHRDRVPPEYVRRQTVRNAERYITDELKRHEQEVLGAADHAKQLELELFEEIRNRVAARTKDLQAAAQAVATLDVLAGLAELSRRRNYCRPEIVTDDNDREKGSSPPRRLLEIVDGRHPVLDVSLEERFVPNDCRLDSEGTRLQLITGPNMAGKSTYIRQAALITLLAHTGSYVPAKSMRWAPVDRIFARVGANDELARGQSTFMVEMVETARILNNATSRSLVILDEIGRGTSTYDGLAIAWAVTEFLVERVNCLALFATHYHELTELVDRLEGAGNLNVAVREQLRAAGAGRDVVFLHKILPGATDRSYGVHVAAMAGLPSQVVHRSEEVLEILERGFDRKSHAKGLTHSARDADQLLLFTEKPLPPIPRGLLAVQEALQQIDVQKTTPLEALALLDRLKRQLAADAGDS